MLQSHGLNDSEMEAAFWFIMKPIAARVFRSFCYFLIAYALLSANEYGLDNKALLLATVVGALGGGSTSARLGLGAIALLLAMALISKETLMLVPI